jgi:hypothetical protein
MKRVAIATGVLAAAATGAIWTAGDVVAAPACPAPVVTVSPQTNVNQDGALTVTGQHLFCTTSTKNGSVDISLHYPGYGASLTKVGIAVSPSGSFTYQFKLSSTFYTAPAGTKIPLLLSVTPPGTTTTTALTGPTITLAAAPPGAGSATSRWNVAAAPTAVPAGHVDVSHTGKTAPWETGALTLGGIAMIAGGAVAVSRRRAIKH